MKISYDPEVDALYLELRPLEPGTAEAHPISEEVIANYGPDGKLAGLEILDASLILGQAEPPGILLEIAPLPAL
jgi:uncharacterized protein YuzE